MATNIYIKFDGVDGESEAGKHKKWIEILSWSHGFTQTVTPSSDKSSGGQTKGQADHSDFSFTKYMDSATDDLLKACWLGKQFQKVNLECYRSAGANEPIKFLEIDFEDVVIANYSISGGGGDLPIENVSLSYAKVKYGYIPVDKDKGTAKGVQPVIHDLKNKKVE